MKRPKTAENTFKPLALKVSKCRPSIWQKLWATRTTSQCHHRLHSEVVSSNTLHATKSQINYACNSSNSSSSSSCKAPKSAVAAKIIFFYCCCQQHLTARPHALYRRSLKQKTIKAIKKSLYTLAAFVAVIFLLVFFSHRQRCPTAIGCWAANGIRSLRCQRMRCCFERDSYSYTCAVLSRLFTLQQLGNSLAIGACYCCYCCCCCSFSFVRSTY